MTSLGFKLELSATPVLYKVVICRSSLERRSTNSLFEVSVLISISSNRLERKGLVLGISFLLDVESLIDELIPDDGMNPTKRKKLTGIQCRLISN